MECGLSKTLSTSTSSVCSLPRASIETLIASGFRFKTGSSVANGAGRKRRRRTYSDPNGGRRNADRAKATPVTTTNAMTLAPNRGESEDDDDDDDDYEDLSDVDGEITKHIFRNVSAGAD